MRQLTQEVEHIIFFRTAEYAPASVVLGGVARPSRVDVREPIDLVRLRTHFRIGNLELLGEGVFIVEYLAQTDEGCSVGVEQEF